MADGINSERLRRYVELKGTKKGQEADLKETQKELDELEAVLLEQFADAGQKAMTLDDGTTIYRHSQLWAARGEGVGDELVVALRASGLEGMTTANWQSFSSEVRERLGLWETETGTPHEDALDQVRDGKFDWSVACPGWGHLIRVNEKVGLNVLGAKKGK